MMTREHYINEITSRLSWIMSQVQIKNSLNLYDIDIHAEPLFCELLNLVFGYKLEDLNHNKTNYASIDLGDKENRIAVQVTAQHTRNKVQNTLDKFTANGYQKEYDRLIVLIIGTKPKFTKPFNVGNDFRFDGISDVWDINYLIKKINEKPVEELSQIYDFFMEQLHPNEGYTGASLNNLGEKMLNEMYAICKAKLLSIGITEKTADQIIAADIDSTKYQYILDEATSGKQYLIGEFGSGKSHALLVLAQRLMKEYLSGNSAIFPLYVQARDIAHIGSVRQWLNDSKYDKTNYFLLIDGLDEIDQNFAIQLIEEINTLSVQYPQNNILAASRPQVLFSATETNFNIRPLTGAECLSLYNIVSDSKDGEDKFRWINEKMKATLARPFFCIIFALFKAEPKGWAKQDIDLITALVTKSMHKAGQHIESAFTDLANIASKAVDRNYGDVHTSDIHFSGNIENVLSTGFITLSDDYISFPLPIIAQWMAAEAVRRNIVNIDDIISNPLRMDRWLYSLSILFSQVSFEESLDFFSRIVQKSPGTASRIIRDGIRFGTMTSLPTAHECGEQLWKAMSIWTDALGPLSNWIAPIDHGSIRPLGINVGNGRITYSWLRPEDDMLPVQVMSFDEMRKKGDTIHSLGVPAQATWSWVISFNYLSNTLKKAIKGHAIIPTEGQLQDEYLWDTLLSISGKNRLNKGTLDLTKFEQHRQFIGRKWQVNGKCVQADFLFYLLDKRLAAGDTTIDAPYPIPDKPNRLGWVWSGYSTERFLEKTQFVYGTAIDEYMKLVNSVFTKLQDSLRIALLAPCKLVGKLSFTENSNDPPMLEWYIYPLPNDKATLVDIQLGKLQSDHSDLLDSLIRNNLRLRPSAGSRATASISFGYINICTSTPVTNLVFSWLEDELKKIGWIDR